MSDYIFKTAPNVLFILSGAFTVREKPHWTWWTKIRRKYVLRNYNLVTIDDMSDLWEVTVSTIYRDIRELRKHGLVEDYRWKLFLRVKREDCPRARLLWTRWEYLPWRRGRS